MYGSSCFGTSSLWVQGKCATMLHGIIEARKKDSMSEEAQSAPQELTEEEKQLLNASCHSGDAPAGPVVLEPMPGSTIKHVIGVVSGKGGVGKSLVTSLLASEANKRGFKVGILDADVTGPSIPKSFGISEPLTGDETGVFPDQTESGIKLISTNLMLPVEDMPVVWRGPVVSGVVKQFFNEVHWGEIDYLFVDMPPGTSDVLLTVFQSLPVDGIVTVSAPQELVSMIVGKAVNMARQMDVPVLGLVENMAYFTCPDCGKQHHIFGEPQGAAVAEHYQIPAYATLPIDPKFAALVDAGKIEEYDVAGALDPIITCIAEAVKE